MTTRSTPSAPAGPLTRRVAIIGGGPRGLSALERLAATAAARPHIRCEVTVYEPFRLGSGHVWRRDQSRQFLMNTPSFFPTVMADEQTLASARGAAGDADPAPSVIPPLTFDRFRERAAGLGADLSQDEAAELAALSSLDYPRRATYGAYLEHVAETLRGSLPSAMTVEHVQAPVDGLRRAADGSFLVEPRGLEPRPFDRVILALGHIDAELNPAQARLRDRAGQAYFPPSVPSDVDWSQIPAGAGVVIKGMGLNFFDVVTELTQGRGGRFAAEGGKFAYVPSGREPRIVALSRRGLPYAAKPDFTGAARLPQLVFATRDRLAELTASGPVSFKEAVWPLIEADVLLAYWEARSAAESHTPASRELAEIRRSVPPLGVPEESLARVAAFTAAQPEEDRLDVERLAKKLVGREFSGAEEHARAVLEAIEEDARSAQNADREPAQHAVHALNEARWALKEWVPEGLLTDASWHKELRGWFEPLVEGLASGPPSLRIAELGALIRAGVVEIAGPSPVVEYDDAAGRFHVTSPWVVEPDGQPAVLSGELLVEAMMPANKVPIAPDPLVRGLVDSGLAQPHPLVIDGVAYSGTGFEVTGPARQIVGLDGPVPGLYCLGLQLSSHEWGTAIAAKAGAAWKGGALTIADADAIARDAL